MGMDVATITARAGAFALVISAIGKAVAMVIWAWRRR
jgi:hypothetical protein